MDNENRVRTIVVADHQEKERLDRYLARQVGDLTRSKIQSMIRESRIKVNNKSVRASTMVNPGDTVLIEYPTPPPARAFPEPIPLDIIFEDDALIALSKQPGMVVHPAHGHRSGTLVNALLHHSDTLSGVGGEFRPGIVHRLDKDTSGFMIIAKSDQVHHNLARQFSSRRVEKEYDAVVWGKFPKPEGSVEAPLGRHPKDRKSFAVVAGGKESHTEYQVLDEYGFLSLVSLKPLTGRTHQLRVHMSHTGHPIFGDGVYGGRNRRLGSLHPSQRTAAAKFLELMPRVALHSRRLRFHHPIRKKLMEIVCPWTEDFRQLVEALRRGDNVQRKKH